MPNDLLAGLRGQLASHNGHARDPDVVAKRFGLPDGKQLKAKDWKRVNDAVETWKAQVLHAAHLLPSKAFRQGFDQTTRFLRLLGVQTGSPTVPRDHATLEWLRWVLEHELTGTLDRYTDQVKSAVLYGQEFTLNPSEIASRLHKATEDANRDWRLVAQTEMARANALGRLAGCQEMGFDEVWVPPHAGSCKACKRLIENKIFLAEELAKASNFGRKESEWVPCLPLHPRLCCRHTAVPWIADIYQEAQDEYKKMQETGLDDDVLAEMFDSSGQLRPQYENDPRLSEFFAGKTVRDPFQHLLGSVIEKTRDSGITVSKGFFDPPQASLDPLIWEDKMGSEDLKLDVRAGIIDFWTGILGDGWQDWAGVYITGSATSYQWGTGWNHPWLGSRQTQVFPDVDTHLVLDYDGVRKARPLWAGMSPMELRKLLEAWVSKAKDGVEIAPGMRLDAYIRTEWSKGEFEEDVRHTGQGVYDVVKDRWLILPTHPTAGEVYGKRILGGLGGRLAHEHPDWITDAELASSQLETLLNAYNENPSENSLEALQVFMDGLYEARTSGFLHGAGQEDRGNWTWAFLSNYGPLLDVKELLHRVG
jgi:hypothetical protein